MRSLRLAAGAALLLGFLGCQNASQTEAAEVKPTGARNEAYNFDLQDSSGNQVKLSDLRGKVVLLNFWATWCSPCRIEIPWFVEFQRNYKDQGLEVVGVSMDEDGWETVKPYLEKMKMNYRILLGDDITAEQYGGVEALPTTFIIDQEGRIASTHVGLVSKDTYETEIKKLLGQSKAEAAGSAGLRASAAAGAK